jgi:hypothetical protein
MSKLPAAEKSTARETARRDTLEPVRARIDHLLQEKRMILERTL